MAQKRMMRACAGVSKSAAMIASWSRVSFQSSSMACWYSAPEYWGFTPLIASQQSSFMGTRTALMFQARIAATAAESTWPSKIPQPCTQAYSVPEWLTPCSFRALPAESAMLEHPLFPRFSFKSLRTGIMAGSPCPAPIMKRVIEKMNAREITIVYGLTETAPGMTQTLADDDLRKRCTDADKEVHDLVEKPSAEEAPSDLAVVTGYILTPEIFEELENTQAGKGGEIWLSDAVPFGRVKESDVLKDDKGNVTRTEWRLVGSGSGYTTKITGPIRKSEPMPKLPFGG